MPFEMSENDNVEVCSEAGLIYESELRSKQAPAFDDVSDVRIALTREARAESVDALNQILADTTTLRDLYKKHHWQASGATFYELHRLFDKHCAEQAVLIDAIAERIQILGGTAMAMAADIAVTTMLPLPPRDRESPPAQVARLIDAHEQVLFYVRAAARRVAEIGDDGTNDVLVRDVIRTNEKQAWFVGELSHNERLSRVV